VGVPVAASPHIPQPGGTGTEILSGMRQRRAGKCQGDFVARSLRSKAGDTKGSEPALTRQNHGDVAQALSLLCRRLSVGIGSRPASLGSLRAEHHLIRSSSLPYSLPEKLMPNSRANWPGKLRRENDRALHKAGQPGGARAEVSFWATTNCTNHTKESVTTAHRSAGLAAASLKSA
jgi:hypothetical protein